VPQDILNAIFDLEDNGIPFFTSTSARDTAYAAWVAAGGVMRNGLYCHVNSIGLQVYEASTWRTVRQGWLNDTINATSGTVTGTTPTTIHSITVTIPPGLYTGQRIKVSGTFYCTTAAGVGAGIAIHCGTERTTSWSVIGDLQCFRFDSSLSAGSRTYNLQTRATVAAQDVNWRYPFLSVEIVG
jgi:hypothetical protein